MTTNKQIVDNNNKENLKQRCWLQRCFKYLGGVAYK